MNRFLSFLSFFGGLLITILGIMIMLDQSNTVSNTKSLSTITLIMVFVVGFSLIVYIVRNKGIK